MLILSGARDTFPDRNRSFFDSLARHVAIFHRGHFNMKIDPIEQRTRDSLPITLHLHRTATTLAFEIAKISARVWVTSS